MREGLVTENTEWITITGKGRHEFLFLLAPLVTIVLALSYAAIFLITTWSSADATYPALKALSPWVTGFVAWIVVASINYYTYRIVRPRLSQQQSSLR